MNTDNKIEKVAEKIIRIRVFEETLLDLFSKGKLFGTTHTYIGQESIASAASEFLDIEHDHVFSSHRCHGHYIALGGPREHLLSEIMGKKSKICNGFGGSQHIKYKNFFSNGIQGGTVGNATGIALAKKVNPNAYSKDSITVVFLGDGTLGEGLVYESLNFASLHDLKILFVVENNQYAQSTPTAKNLAGSIEKRAEAFGIRHSILNSNDPLENLDELEKAINFVRTESKPFVQVINTYRLGPHSKGDDNRDKAEIEEHRKNDPLNFLKKYIGESEVQKILQEEQTSLHEHFLQVDSEEFSSMKNNTIPNINQEILRSFTTNISTEINLDLNFLTSINKALDEILESDNSFLIGEDIIDPYGGAFKVTKGLTAKHLKKVFTTPISESGIVAWSTGAALVGFKPVAEIMFSDFMTLAFDQILNHATKFHWMYNYQVECPILIRTAAGAGRGYGPTHSQSIEKYFVGVSGLTIFVPNLYVDPGSLLKTIHKESKHPTMFIEHKTLYPKKLVHESSLSSLFQVSISGLMNANRLYSPSQFSSKTVVVSYGAFAGLALDISKKLLVDAEIDSDVFIPVNIWPLSQDYFETLKSYKNIIILEENDEYAGWGAEIISQLAQKYSDKKYLRVGTKNFILPSCGILENELLPNLENSIGRILDFLEN